MFFTYYAFYIKRIELDSNMLHKDKDKFAKTMLDRYKERLSLFVLHMILA